ncbi:SUKH-4 family immunity protein [Actinomadura craniellae]|uniref:SUKH-4 family immunity protein n=1 Tax=Actinomadura craniellae TaxID=2231787 RepID=UPI0018F26AD5|nr:SUKH-4 family immunity protein [Actinomadura craniellae]
MEPETVTHPPEALGRPADPAARRLLAEAGLPRALIGVFFAADRLEPPPAGTPGIVPADHLVLGRSREGDLLCLHLPSGEVLLVEPRGLMEVSLVNTTLGRFLECAALVRDRYPFSFADPGGAADALEAALEALDPACLPADGFWDCLLSDIANGDHSG